MQLHGVPHCSLSVISDFLRLRYLDGVFLSYFFRLGFCGRQSRWSLCCLCPVMTCSHPMRGFAGVVCVCALFPAASFMLGFFVSSLLLVCSSPRPRQVFSLSCLLRSRSWNTDVGSHQNGPAGSTPLWSFQSPVWALEVSSSFVVSMPYTSSYL